MAEAGVSEPRASEPRVSALVVGGPSASEPRAVLLDVDFTLLCPSELFSAEGYRAAGARFGLRLDTRRWRDAERRAARAVEGRRAGRGNVHDDAVYEVIAAAIVTGMGGHDAARVERCAAAIVEAWGRCANFSLYDDARPCLTGLRDAGLSVGLISNTNRDLDEVLDAFDLRHLVDGVVTSAQVGLFKPAREIFAAALACIGAEARDTVMVGDSYRDDVEGALAAGLSAVLLDRDGGRAAALSGARLEAPVIASLAELPALLGLPRPAPADDAALV
jgi:HAD superfamily hydrolase (TIGR01549 family)